MEAYEFSFDLQLEILNDLLTKLNFEEFLKFSVFHDLESPSCGGLTVSKTRVSLEPKDSPLKTIEPCKKGVKRAASTVIKKQVAVKNVKKEASGEKQAPLPAAETQFQRNPDDFIGAMQSLDTGNKVFSCQFCGLQGSQKANVRRHVILKHIPEAKQELKCSMCLKEFNLKQHLKAHYMHYHSLSDGLAKAAMNGL